MSAWIYVLVMGVTTLAIRMLPVLLIRRPIENVYVRSFLSYVPYATLAAMTVPAIFYATSSPLAGVVALALGIVAAWRGAGLPVVALICCASVLVVQAAGA